MAELFNAYAQGVQLGQQQRDAREKRNRLAELESLAPQVMTGDPTASSRAYALDPKRAEDYQKAGDRQQQQLLGLAKTLKQSAGNPQMQAGVYRSAVPFLRSSFGDGIPDEFDAAVVMPVVDQLLAVSANTPTLGAQTPTDVRSFQMMTQGLSAEDTERARRINLGLDGRASTSGFSQVKFTGADGRERLGVLNGRTGQIDLPDGTSFNPQTGAISQTSGTQQGAAQPAAQATVFRAPNGEVIDLSQVPEPALRESIMQNPAQWGLVPDGGSVQLPPQTVPPPQAGGGMFVGRAPEDQAAATEAARLGAQMQYLPQELQMRTNAALQQEAGKIRVQQQGERDAASATRLRDAEETVEVLNEALPLLDTATGSGLGAARDRSAAFFGKATDGAQANAQLRVLATRLTAKVPRFEGPQSDKDVAEYKAAAGDLANEALPTEIRLAAGQTLKRLSEKAIKQARKSPAGQSDAPQRIQSAADYNALPSGALFIAPDGTQRRKR